MARFLRIAACVAAGCLAASAAWSAELKPFQFLFGEGRYFNGLFGCLQTQTQACPDRDELVRKPEMCLEVEDMAICRDVEFRINSDGTIIRSFEVEVARRAKSHCMLAIMLVHHPDGAIGTSKTVMHLRTFKAEYLNGLDIYLEARAAPAVVVSRRILDDPAVRRKLCGS